MSTVVADQLIGTSLDTGEFLRDSLLRVPREATRNLRSVDREDATDPLPAEAGVSGTQARILRAGLDLFAERGYHATSIRDIAGAAGLQSASLYTHFASKEAILARLVLLGSEVHHRALVAALVGAGSDPRDQLQALIRAHVTLHCRYPRLAVVTTNESAHLEPAAFAPAAALQGASLDLAREVLERGVAQEVFHLVDPEITQVAISSMGVAASVWYPARAGHLTPEHVGDVYAELVLRLVGASAVRPAHAPAPLPPSP